MQSLLGKALDIASGLVSPHRAGVDDPLSLVYSQDELEAGGFVADHVHGVDGVVPSRLDRHEPDDGQAKVLGSPQSSILRMLWVVPAVLVALESVLAHLVGVGRQLVGRRVHRSDGQSCSQVPGLSDAALHVHEGHGFTGELKTA